MTEPIAHTKYKGKKKVTQTLKKHSDETASLSGNFLKGCGLMNTGYLSGLLHDMGKADESFQGRDSDSDEKTNHTSAGVKYIREELGKEENTSSGLLTKDILSYAVGSHHSLFDCTMPYRMDGFDAKVQRTPEGYEGAKTLFFTYCADKRSTDFRYRSSKEEIGKLYQKVLDMPLCGTKAEIAVKRQYIFGFAARVILSALTDADRINTYCFQSGNKYEYPDFIWPGKMERFSKWIDTGQKKKISESGENPDWVSSLNFPDRAGRTELELIYAVSHAAKFKKRHIIYAGNGIDKCLEVKDRCGEMLGLSAFIDFSDCDHENYEDESWDGVFTICTKQRFWDVLFSSRLQDVRKLHSFTQSIVILDEPDAVPKDLKKMQELSVLTMSKLFRTTFLLSSGKSISQSAKGADINAAELISYNEEDWIQYRKPIDKEESDKNAPAQAKEVLFVKNTEEAKSLISAIGDKAGYKVLLSSMCEAHKNAVKNSTGKDTLLFITDKDLPDNKDITIFRAKEEDGIPNKKYRIDFAEYLPEIDIEQIDIEEETKESLLKDLKEDPARYGFYEQSEEWITAYESRIRKKWKERARERWNSVSGKERRYSPISLYEMLSAAGCFPLPDTKEGFKTSDCERMLEYAPATAGDKYLKLYGYKENERYKTKVLTPYGEAKNIINDIENGADTDKEKIKALLKKHSVLLSEEELKKAEKEGKVKQSREKQWYALPEYYDDTYGLI